MEKILADPAQLGRISSDEALAVRSLTDALRQAREVLKELGSIWKGEAGEACRRRLEEDLLRMEKISEACRKANEWSREICASYQREAQRLEAAAGETVS